MGRVFNIRGALILGRGLLGREHGVCSFAAGVSMGSLEQAL